MKITVSGFLILFSVIVGIIILLLGIALGASLGPEWEYSRTDKATWIAALSTFAIAILTLYLVFETAGLRKLTQQQIDGIRLSSLKPSVDVYLQPSKARLEYLEIYVVNQGQGTAHDVVFSVVDESSEACKAIGFNVTLLALLKEIGLFTNGITALGAGREFRSLLIDFTDYNDLGNDLFGAKLRIVVTCKDSEKNFIENVSTIDLQEFIGITGSSSADPLHGINENLKKISKRIEKITSRNSSDKLDVNVWNSNDRSKQLEKDKKNMAALKQSRIQTRKNQEKTES